ncbi:MAG: hypothetical protein COB78_10155 [Hyphomicrobiales bacterium]|nr:MAG: hypothetical protein COB78_10155 [Hyphomicrobiales bacterium]
MRVINLDRLQLPEHWQDRADAAIADEQDKINDHSDVWRDLKDPLKELSNDKCYYCEVIQERADGAVDHFRPKKNYPWSAFSSTNYRFACTFCNSRRTDKKTKRTGGKGENFPLFDETKRANCCGDEADESPILLDPCNPNEPGLIDFDETGAPMPAFSEAEHIGKNKRATVSIDLYHLDHADLVDKRKILAVKIAREVKVADRLFPQTESGDANIDASFREHIRFLADCANERAELSAFARRILAGYRNLSWVDGLLASI